MADELSELDELIESDVLEALGEKVAEDNSSIEIDGITLEDIEAPAQDNETIEESLDNIDLELDTTEETPAEELEETLEETEQIQTESSNEKTVTSSDLASLLSELLNNKTIEITIKIKD